MLVHLHKIDKPITANEFEAKLVGEYIEGVFRKVPWWVETESGAHYSWMICSGDACGELAYVPDTGDMYIDSSYTKDTPEETESFVKRTLSRQISRP